MKVKTQFDWRLTFIIDVVIVLGLVFTGRGIIGALFISQIFMWLVRLYWINQAMLRYILRRLLHMIPILLMVIALGFALLQLAPGDSFTRLYLQQDINQETIDRFRAEFALDKHWTVQFFRYVWNVLQGDFGFSAEYKIGVFEMVQQRMWPTLLLSGTALIFSWGLSIPMGIIAATKQYKWPDQIISVFAFIGLAIPNFFLAFLLLYFVTATSQGIPGTWLPIGGMTSVNFTSMGPINQFFDVLWHLILPLFVLGTSAMAGLTRIMRANMLEILHQQYIVTARAKGQSERIVVFRHALRNAINPMITILGFQIANILSGAALTEAVLSWPGLGQLVLQAILSQDMFLVIGILLYSSILLVIGNLIADILLAVTDPRVRVG
ncbi:ABC transporter permease [Salinispira pacifica]|uniref:Oligopeptide transport system permease protein OppB n=1 Tax=Salinispira pacifica TaxID=1307761 RepID=V5WL67_9SPIO|nr:ABC transporter permease [Salinispira pacifica]AHC16400.1 Oligopeptide transport system permease protein OppB [Salinispira pacifica]